MSHTFTVAEAGALRVADVQELFGIKGFRFREGTELPNGGGWPRGVAHGYLHGVSTRPLETTFDGESFEVRVLTCTDAPTVDLACKLAAHAAKQGAGKVRSEDHSEALPVADFERRYDAAWAGEHARLGFSMICEMFARGASEPRMSGTTAELVLGARSLASLPRTPDAFERELSYRFRLLNYPGEHPVFFCSLITVANGDESRTVRLSSYAAVPTVISADADLVAFGRQDDLLHLSFARFTELCGGRWITESLYLAPELNAEQLAALLDRTRPHAVTDMFEYGRPKELAAEKKSSASDDPEENARRIVRIPALVFLLIAGADGKIEKKEVQAFQARLGKLLKVPNPGLADIMTGSLRMFEHAVQAVVDGKLEPALALADGADALEKEFPEEAATVLKQVYLNIGLEIANATATGFFRKKIRDTEVNALALVATLLRIPLPKE